ncbi:UDP-GlcNAc:betaGal beta-1,3-N-acetylglucosaminyltransferase-like protein 1 [Glossina fuscipes]|uniref:UDP-GlcNAc:betaGal beta-1,3-N-acetylglucosaminyltransferase-like protein 1 n=1 Tax=Glossina fuscipes TaxID=7396 RepID=A0A8U0WDL9_9MUSC|nr:UDP-GlcNAc:betaGal beta-1,3-N-acetylglucosaminyltransferase-like protein 1 [Glossina fuscipes]KAI9586665.1 hypothetical protein GQX74_002512 [Glossina fuscipes]
MPQQREINDVISVIITILNGSKWITNCMQSILQQTAVKKTNKAQDATTTNISNRTNRTTSLIHLNKEKKTQKNLAEVFVEVCVFDDCSSDCTFQMLCEWEKKLKEYDNVDMRIVTNMTGSSKGVGYGRNKAIAASTGSYLCFQDVDDEMLPGRLLKQYQLAKQYKNAIIGSKFVRIPSNATCRFTKWANDLSEEKFNLQIFTSNGPTIIMPTWMCHRQVYDCIQGGFCEDGSGCPEDLLFFYKHIKQKNGQIKRVNECLVKYRYHTESTTFSVHAATIWNIRLKYLIENQLQNIPWKDGFTIWNAGKQGRRFFRDLPSLEKFKVKAFCDVDKNKIKKNYHYYDMEKRQFTFSIPIIHFTQVKPPLIICMKLDLTNGDFERNLKSLQLIEGQDYILFT